MKKPLLTLGLLLFLVVPHAAHAAIAYDAGSSGTNGNAGPTLTFSHTVTGTDPVLTCLAWRNGNSDDLVGMTFNGVAMTQVDKTVNSDNNNFLYSYILAGPATGAHNVVITSTTNPSNLHGICQSYTGANQTGQPDAHAKQSTTVGSGGTVSTSVTTVADNDWVVSFAGGAGDPPNASTGVTQRVTDGANEKGGDSNGPKTPAGSYTSTWANGGAGSESVTVLSMAIKPVGAVATPKSILGLVWAYWF